ncbi:N-formylglutamate amidohydrolase [Formosa sp. 3Alg 14/1]|uniref:N-formylglutamate amidohydrolase n=1 Tax=Formosa sp. 3Alg 14/1 TaxID=3382190 RepID=UPI0039BE2064
MKLLLTCEHGGHTIPKMFADMFKDNKTTLQSHRGFDIGALDVFNYLKPLSDYSNFSTTSRLLIELNRSLHHRHLFSEFSKSLSPLHKERLIERYYKVYRNSVVQYISENINKGDVILHVSVHSFTPVLNDITRHCDIGLLYDPIKAEESQFCKHFKSELHLENPNLKVRFNYPYRGTADGFTTHLRRLFPDNYIGIEIEINQKFASKNSMPSSLKHQMYSALKSSIIR